MPQLRLFPWTAALIFAIGAWACGPAFAFYKCSVNGAVTYQDSPCGSMTPRKPTQRSELSATSPARRTDVGAGAAASAPRSENGAAQGGGLSIVPRSANAGAGASPYRCDGRTHCSQMRSCAEATFFLKNCPGVKMDGNGDGLPCEKQWCNS